MATHSSYSPEIEQSFLGILLAEPSAWAEINMVTRNDFAQVRRHIFDIIKSQLDAVPPQPVNPIILVEKLKSYGQSAIDIGGVDLLTYLTGLSDRGRMLRKEEAMNLLKELKLLTVKREQIARCEAAKQKVSEAKTFDEVVKAVDTELTNVSVDYFRSQTTLMFDGFIDVMEERRLNPIDSETIGYQGPFPSINSTIGSVIAPAEFCVVGARTGGSKSALGFFYNTYIVERYGVTCLHLDANEMPRKQLTDRAACCLSAGRIPLWAVKSGEWGKNKEWLDCWRGDVVPRLKKIMPLIHYQNIGGMTPEEIISFIKRFYYKNVGREGFLAVHVDYIKGMSSMSSGRDSEHKVIGDYIDRLKGLITDQIQASIWTSVQLNRGGITTGKKLDDIIDSEDNYSLSDRIIQQATNGFTMRYKMPEELAKEKNMFGNIVLKHLKGRDLVGKQYQAALRPIKLSSGKFVKNYYNLDTQGFHFTDKGDLNQMLKTLGHVAVDLANKDAEEEKMP